MAGKGRVAVCSKGFEERNNNVQSSKYQTEHIFLTTQQCNSCNPSIQLHNKETYLTPMVNMSMSLRFCIHPSNMMKPMIQNEYNDNCLPRIPILRWRGVFGACKEENNKHSKGALYSTQQERVCGTHFLRYDYSKEQ